MEMDSGGVEISEFRFEKGDHELALDPSRTYSYYVISGELEINGQKSLTDDFIICSEEKNMKLRIAEDTTLFMIAVPAVLSYPTYIELTKR